MQVRRVRSCSRLQSGFTAALPAFLPYEAVEDCDARNHKGRGNKYLDRQENILRCRQRFVSVRRCRIVLLRFGFDLFVHFYPSHSRETCVDRSGPNTRVLAGAEPCRLRRG